MEYAPLAHMEYAPLMLAHMEYAPLAHMEYAKVNLSHIEYAPLGPYGICAAKARPIWNMRR